MMKRNSGVAVIGSILTVATLALFGVVAWIVDDAMTDVIEGARSNLLYTQASFYGEAHRDKPTASGEPFNPDAPTCASWDYPFGTILDVYRVGVDGRVVGEPVSVRVNDRGPARRLYDQGRRLDLSRAAFEALAPLDLGVINVAACVRSEKVGSFSDKNNDLNVINVTTPARHDR